MLAVLEEALRTILGARAPGTKGDAAKPRREALVWLMSEESTAPFAFRSICETVGLDARRLRARVLGCVAASLAPMTQ